MELVLAKKVKKGNILQEWTLPNRWGEGQEAGARLELYGRLRLQKRGMSVMIMTVLSLLSSQLIVMMITMIMIHEHDSYWVAQVAG